MSGLTQERDQEGTQPPSCARKRSASPWCGAPGVGELGALDPGEKGHKGGLVEGEEAGQHDEEDHATGPNVRGAAVVALFWGVWVMEEVLGPGQC